MFTAPAGHMLSQAKTTKTFYAILSCKTRDVYVHGTDKYRKKGNSHSHTFTGKIHRMSKSNKVYVLFCGIKENEGDDEALKDNVCERRVN